MKTNTKFRSCLQHWDSRRCSSHREQRFVVLHQKNLHHLGQVVFEGDELVDEYMYGPKKKTMTEKEGSSPHSTPLKTPNETPNEVSTVSSATTTSSIATASTSPFDRSCATNGEKLKKKSWLCDTN